MKITTNTMDNTRLNRRPSDNSDVSTFLFRSGFNFAKRHYVLSASYVLGLLLFNFASGLSVNAIQKHEFDSALATINVRKLDASKEQWMIAQDEYRASKGWFFTCDEFCTKNYEVMKSAEAVVALGEKEYEEKLSSARSRVGIFSEYGVGDVKEMFWEAYDRGSTFARRMSYYDALIMSVSAMRSDQSLLSVFLNWLLQAAMNFSIGMLSTLVSFAVHVGGLIISYQAHPMSGIAFFFLAMTGAFAVIATFVVGVYFAAATTAFVVLKVAGPNFRIEFNPEARGQRFLREQPRTHGE